MKTNEEYYRLTAECKECAKKRSLQWQYDNYDYWLDKVRELSKKDNYKQAKRERNKKLRENGYNLQYQRENKDKIKQYNLNRRHKNHDITNEEWIVCKTYFNFQCAYCGFSEEEHRKMYNQDLHKEHVDHNGANDLSNCVPSCRSCNSQKWKYELEDWYNDDNEIYSIVRLEKINTWLNDDYKKYIKTKLN